jgi:Tn3 transposase DDE domain
MCRYLWQRELRREIHEDLNVVENWHSANDFILFGKGGDIATNRRDDQELAMLTLHLLQNALVYTNTLMRQRVLSEAAWDNRLTPEDLRALTPLIYGHISPYGTFLLDMQTGSILSCLWRLDRSCPLSIRLRRHLQRDTASQVAVPQHNSLRGSPQHPNSAARDGRYFAAGDTRVGFGSIRC